jgi:choice-of-anchor A domain-containing protein
VNSGARFVYISRFSALRSLCCLAIFVAAPGLRPVLAQSSSSIVIVNYYDPNSSAGILGNFPGGITLGEASHFSLLALGGGIDDSGPTGPDADPYTVSGDAGVASSGQKFSASGDVTYGGQVYIHSGSTYNSSASGVPPPTTGPNVDVMLEQAKQDAFNASTNATTLGQNPTASYGTINNNFSIVESTPGDYVFDITGINFSGGKVLTLSAPSGSSFLLNISQQLVLTFGSIQVAGGLSAANVLINYTGTDDVRFSGGGNASEIDGTILAPNAGVSLSPGVVVGSVIANSVQMSSGANVIPEPGTNALLCVAAGMAAATATIRRKKTRSKV